MGRKDKALAPSSSSFGSSSVSVKLDGRTGEGGGQVVRIAACLAALTGISLRIDNVRGNRMGKVRGGGLKAQHVAGIRCLAEITQAEVVGCQVGCKTLQFRSRGMPAELVNRNILIKSDTPGSVMMVLQALLPFLVFAGDDNNTPITLTIQGGTNVSFSPSYEYIDQVLLPALEMFGIRVERKLEKRGWSFGPRQIGVASFKIHPLAQGQCLENPVWPTEQGVMRRIEAFLVVPSILHELLKDNLLIEIGRAFPEVDIDFKLVEDSKHGSRIYTLLVAHTTKGLRFGRDWLYNEKSKGMDRERLCTRVAQKVVDDLHTEMQKQGLVDEFLEDQLIIFRSLAGGKSAIATSVDGLVSGDKPLDQTDQPFGVGSLHTTTARWVVSQILPNITWRDDGRVCEGAGWKVEPPASIASLTDVLGDPRLD